MIRAVGRVLALALALLLAAAPALPQTAAPSRPAEGVLSLLPPTAATRGETAIGGARVAYVAEAGTLPIHDGGGALIAEMFYTAYTAENGPAGRPITFAFNGGPGAAAAFLHLGALGPKVLAVSAAGEVLPPPQAIADNPDNWLDLTDLVFVDPIGTGYSRAAKADGDRQFWNVARDVETTAAFIRLYLQRSGRLLSPVYLVGESYGGLRAALVARSLQSGAGINPSGLVLVSPALEMMLIRAPDYEPLSWALTLPALAAANLERQGVRGRAELARRLAEVERYAMTDYLAALVAPLSVGGAAASETVARHTGLPVDLVRRHFARVSNGLFARERERAGGLVLSQYDGAIASPDRDPASPHLRGPDPVLDATVTALASAFVAYARDTLGYRTDVTYRVLNREVASHWDFGRDGRSQGWAGALHALAEARARNLEMRVLVAHGYTDLVTPYPMASFLVGQIPPLQGAPPIEVAVYEGGHMMYMRPQSRRALKEDAAKLYRRTPVPAAAGAD